MLFLWLWMGVAFASECQWDVPEFYHAQEKSQVTVSGEGDLIGQETQFSFDSPIDILTGDYKIKATQGSFDILSQKLVAEGLELNTSKFIIQAKKAVIVVTSGKGHLQQVRYLQKKSKSLMDAEAKKVVWDGEQLTLTDATYSECPRHQRSWEIYAKSIQVDHEGSYLQFTEPGFRLYGRDLGSISTTMGMSMGSHGATGWLFPTWQINGRLGFGVGLPYYIWASKDMDIEMTPMVYTKPSFGVHGKLRWMDGLFYWEGFMYAYPLDHTEFTKGRYAYSISLTSHPEAKFHVGAQLSHVFDKDWTRDFSEVDRDNQFFIPSYLEVSEKMPMTQWHFLLRRYQFLDNSEGQKMYAFDRLPEVKVRHQFNEHWSVNVSAGLFSPVGIFPETIKAGGRLTGEVKYYNQGPVDLTLSAKGLSFLQNANKPKQVIVPGVNIKWVNKDRHIELDWVRYHQQDDFPIYIDTHRAEGFLKPIFLDDRIPDRSDLIFGITSDWDGYEVDLSTHFVFAKHRICVDQDCEVDWLASHHIIPLIIRVDKKGGSNFSFMSELVHEKPYVNQWHLVYEKQSELVTFAIKYDWRARYYSFVQEKMTSGASLLSAEVKFDLDQGWNLDIAPKYMYDGRNKMGYVADLYYQDCCSKFGVSLTLKPQVYDQSLGFNHRPKVAFSYQLGA